jgi:peptidoglycan hydrolase-like protein with peptidoglycan-binding domain
MKAVLPLALIGALAVGTAYAAGGSQTKGLEGGSPQTSMSHSRMSQSQVKDLQSKLKQQGYYEGQVDGRIGPNTQQAIRQFQEDKGINATGTADPQTMAALNSNQGTQQGQLPSGSKSKAPSSSSGTMGGPSGSSSSGSSGSSGMGGGSYNQQPSGGSSQSNPPGTSH